MSSNNIRSRCCCYPNCTNPVFAKHYCKFHQNERTDPDWIRKQEIKRLAEANKKAARRTAKPAINFNFTPIKKNSKARAAINRIYEKEAREFRAEVQVCQICPVLHAAGVNPGFKCSGEAESVHHTEGKATIELLLDRSKWLGACFFGNNWVEANSAIAKELLLKKPNYSSKLSYFKK